MTNNSSQEFNVGDVIEVKVSSFANYGVFCECPGGYKGLIHISNITNGFVKDANDYFELNETVKAEIMTIDNEAKKLGLSTKQFNLKSKKANAPYKSFDNNKKFKKF